MQTRFAAPALALILAAVSVSASAALAAPVASPPLPGFDFTQSGATDAWKPLHGISALEPTPEGMRIAISGIDPYMQGPPADLPGDGPLWVFVRLKSSSTGALQVFYMGPGQGPDEARSVRMNVTKDRWTEVRATLPALGPGTRLRIDPPGQDGEAVIASVRFERRILHKMPEWPKPAPAAPGADAGVITSGDVVVRQSPSRLGGTAVEVAGRLMAAGLEPALIGYVQGGRTRWVSTADARCTGRADGAAWVQTATLADPDGGAWTITRRFSPAAAGAVDVNVSVAVSQPRDVLFLPMLMLLPGQGAFGRAKGQAIFAGLEYLSDEPSSSEADIRGPASRRQTPARHKITFPLMTVQADGRYVGLAWDNDPRFTPVFDSPDRLFGAEGHVMGVLFPGSDGENREEGSLLPYLPERLDPGRPLALRVAIVGGKGDSVIPAVQQYVRMHPLPPLPDAGLDWPGYARLAGYGWLDSKCREGNLYRHAVWPGFLPQAAADVSVWMTYLAEQTAAAGLGARLREAAAGALAQVPPDSYLLARISHVSPPLAPLVCGAVGPADGGAAAQAGAGAASGAAGQAGHPVALAVARSLRLGREQVRRFQPDGTLPYRQAEGKPDYGSTHSEPDANGMTALAVRTVLEAAVFTGDADLVRDGLRLLAGLDRFDNTVPRGAQTWEIPLHTPDILASAHLVRAYTLGYLLTGDEALRARAVYWAWTGVPFVYLVNPTPGRVGPYSTIAVLGATSWQAPVWFGQPVQWCGLVYADALYDLAPLDPDGPWRRLADGIAAAGIQHTWKEDDADRAGLLPDFFHLREQYADGPAINPGSLQASALRLYGRPPIYGMAVLRRAGVFVHAPGAVVVEADEPGRAAIRVTPWASRPVDVLVSGLKARPEVRLNGQAMAIESPHAWLPSGCVALRVRGETAVELRLGQ